MLSLSHWMHMESRMRRVNRFGPTEIKTLGLYR